jgi:hypothetical protein
LATVSPNEQTHEDTGVDPTRRSAASPPRWPTVLGIGAVILVVALFAVLHLTGVLGGGGH